MDPSTPSGAPTTRAGNAPAGITTIRVKQLREKMRREAPDNDDRAKGWALVNVLSPEQFANGHIPSSINIPQASIDEFTRRFDTGKDIVVYCGSPGCEASGDTAAALARLGFQHVVLFEGGLADWAEEGNLIGHETA